MKTTLALLSLLCLSLTAHAYRPGKTYKLTVLHTNDHHGRFWPNKDGEYGLAARATLIQKLRNEIQSEGGHVLLLDAGDVNTGIPQSDLLDAEPDFKGMAKLGYDAMALGNHEFDNPMPILLKQRKWAKFPFLSANIYYTKTMKRAFPSHINKEFDDLKVTIMGLTTEDTPQKTSAINVKGLTFVPAVAEAKSLVPKLRPKTDVLIAVTHIGHYSNEAHGIDAPGDVTLARQVNGIDLIVGGHTQKPLFEPDIQNGTVIAQAYEWGKYVGRVDFEFLDGKLTLKSSKLIPVNLKTVTDRIAPDAEMENFLKPFKDKGDASLLVELGDAEVTFLGGSEGRKQETNLGNLVTQAFRERFKTDVALVNSGSLRDSLPAGKITYETVLTVLPFGGEIVTVSLTGQELLNHLEYVVFNMTPGSGGFPQISGVEIKGSKEEKKIKSLLINGRPVELEKTYTLSTPEFIANGGDKYPKLNYKKTGFTDADILKDYILSVKTLKDAQFSPRSYIVLE